MKSLRSRVSSQCNKDGYIQQDHRRGGGRRRCCALITTMCGALGSWLSAWERSRQPEPREHGVLKAGHGADPVAGKREHEEADPVADAVGGAQVGPERRLTVGSRRDEVEPPARAEQAGAEAGHDVSTLVLEGHRR